MSLSKSGIGGDGNSGQFTFADQLFAGFDGLALGLFQFLFCLAPLVTAGQKLSRQQWRKLIVFLCDRRKLSRFRQQIAIAGGG
jgi:hypothetical protein